jgi:Tol biopolymer transport system component
VQYLDFEIDVTGGESGQYTVKVRSPAGEAMTLMRFPFDQSTLTNRLQALQIALLRSSVTRRRIASPESRTVQEFGQELWSALFSGDVLSRYEASRQEAKHQQSGIRIKFRCDEPELAALPWEYLFDPVRGDFVALSASTPLVRYIPLPESMPPLLVTPPIRILAVAVSPSDLDGLDVERERSRLNAAMAPIQAKGLVELEWIPGQTWQDFMDAVSEGPWHVLHFIGHGGFDENRQEGIVAFARPDGRAEYKRATSLGRVLGDHEPLRLAVLNACESGRSDVTDLFSSTAGTLVRKGTPAVVAMQYEITDEAAIELSRSFYGSVARGVPVDTALTEARKGLATAFEDTLEWGTPVLYLQAPDGVLFDIKAAPVAADVPGVAAASVVAATIAKSPIEAPPVVVPPGEPPAGPPAEPPPPPEAIPAPEPGRAEPVEPEPPKPEPVPPPPPPPRLPIALLAAGGGAAVLGIVLAVNILGGGGGGGESASPLRSDSAPTVVAFSNAPSSSDGSSVPASEVPASGIDTLLATGRGILFHAYTGARDQTSSDSSEIYLLDPDGTRVERVTDNGRPDRWPRWSPKDDLFAFTRINDGVGDILTMDTAGTETQLTSGSDNDWAPEVAPNDFIYFNSDRVRAGDDSINVWRVAPRTGVEPTFVTGAPGADDRSPAWSPDGTRMAFSSDRDAAIRGERAIFTADAGDIRGTPEPLTFGGTVDRNPTWRSDGRVLLFTRNPIGSDDERDIWSLDLDTGEERPVSEDPADEGSPVFSPEGDRIAFYRLVDEAWHLIILDLDSGDEEDLTETRSLEGHSIDPSWR